VATGQFRVRLSEECVVPTEPISLGTVASTTPRKLALLQFVSYLKFFVSSDPTLLHYHRQLHLGSSECTYSHRK